MGKKKYQIFISSTYLDLQDERQAAVEAILGSKHIPAGMELFRAGNASQLDTIKKWIDESDIYMLILGGRYGSIEPKTGKSYTHLEYEYALKKEIPVFAVVLSESFLFTKAAEKSYEVFEKDNKEKYDEFKTYVMTKMIKEVDDCKDIKIAIKDSISDFESEASLSGWVRASEVEDYTEIIKENNRLLKENEKLLGELRKIKNNNKIGVYEFEKLKNLFENKKVVLPAKCFNSDEDIEITYLDFIVKFKNNLITGVSNDSRNGSATAYVYKNICPFYVQFGLMQVNNSTKTRRIFMTKEGQNFVARLEIEKEL